MIGDKAAELIQELERTKDGPLPHFNEDALRQIFQEMETLFAQNQKDANSVPRDASYFPGVYFRHAILKRNKRCVLAYIYNRMKRIKEMRWDLGSILPPQIRSSLAHSEVLWFNRYNKNLASYMRTLGEGKGLDLTQDITPPKSLFVEVRCLQDYGELELDDGDIIMLQKNTSHLLPMSHCQHLIRQGILQHIA